MSKHTEHIAFFIRQKLQLPALYVRAAALLLLALLLLRHRTAAAAGGTGGTGGKPQAESVLHDTDE